MYLSATEGRYWVELTDQATADWESFRMNHAVAKYFQKALMDRRSSPPGELARARFFSLRNRNADPVSTAMTVRNRIQIGVGRSNLSPFPCFEPDYRVLAAHLSISFSTACYPYGRGIPSR
ncbi:MAG TPA: hypothetical protein VK943_03120 [Arenibaculum sp.]|nr:hypothetical protein [Arenibaculum sp.]